jgi:hypothetical protein
MMIDGKVIVTLWSAKPTLVVGEVDLLKLVGRDVSCLDL